jgi:hypothetical protein
MFCGIHEVFLLSLLSERHDFFHLEINLWACTIRWQIEVHVSFHWLQSDGQFSHIMSSDSLQELLFLSYWILF